MDKPLIYIIISESNNRPKTEMNFFEKMMGHFDMRHFSIQYIDPNNFEKCIQYETIKGKLLKHQDNFRAFFICDDENDKINKTEDIINHFKGLLDNNSDDWFTLLAKQGSSATFEDFLEYISTNKKRKNKNEKYNFKKESDHKSNKDVFYFVIRQYHPNGKKVKYKKEIFKHMQSYPLFTELFKTLEEYIEWSDE